jgi:xylan 1,4-beta-xylosidase
MGMYAVNPEKDEDCKALFMNLCWKQGKNRG